MTSILISSDDDTVSEDLARQLTAGDDYTYLGDELLDRVAEQHEVERQQLRWALDGTGGRKLSRSQRNLLLCHIETAVLEALAADNVVSVGLAAHLYVKNVSHILHLRVLANPDKRLERIVEEEGLSPRRAQKRVEKEKQGRVRWSCELFGVDESNPALYDIVVQLKQIDAHRVLQIVQDTAGFRGFRTMTYSRNCLQDLLLANRARGALLPEYPDIRTMADGDRVIVHVKCAKRKKQQVVSGIKETASKVEGVGLVEVHAVSNLKAITVDDEQEPRQFVNGD